MRARPSSGPAAVLAFVLVASLATGRSAEAVARSVEELGASSWIDRIDGIVGRRPMSIAIGNDGESWYRHRSGIDRPPASNEKILLSMALLQRFSTGKTIPTRVMSPRRPVGGVVRGNLWIVGAGDPESGPVAMNALAGQLVDRGIRRIRGRVVGATTPFVRDWWAAGWRDYFPSVYVQIPTALTFRGNEGPSGRHVSDPEERAAAYLTKVLERRGIPVSGRPSMAPAPNGLVTLAEVRSDDLLAVMDRMNTVSSNLRAEVLGKMLGRSRFGQPSIAGGARALRAFVRARGLRATTYDSSGLSYRNRIDADTLLRLLWFADARTWGDGFRDTLPMSGEGTLRGRLEQVTVHAKTGTLIDVSALSGWVWSERSQQWVEFSIMSRGIDASDAKVIEDRIVRVVANRATDPTP